MFLYIYIYVYVYSLIHHLNLTKKLVAHKDLRSYRMCLALNEIFQSYADYTNMLKHVSNVRLEKGLFKCNGLIISLKDIIYFFLLFGDQFAPISLAFSALHYFGNIKYLINFVHMYCY